MLENVQADDQTQVRITGSGGGDAGRRFKNLITSRAEFQSDDGADARLTVICFIFCHFLRRGRRS
jgi:hypothetical protein